MRRGRARRSSRRRGRRSRCRARRGRTARASRRLCRVAAADACTSRGRLPAGRISRVMRDRSQDILFAVVVAAALAMAVLAALVWGHFVSDGPRRSRRGARGPQDDPRAAVDHLVAGGDEAESGGRAPGGRASRAPGRCARAAALAGRRRSPRLRPRCPAGAAGAARARDPHALLDARPEGPARHRDPVPAWQARDGRARRPRWLRLHGHRPQARARPQRRQSRPLQGPRERAAAHGREVHDDGRRRATRPPDACRNARGRGRAEPPAPDPRPADRASCTAPGTRKRAVRAAPASVRRS